MRIAWRRICRSPAIHIGMWDFCITDFHRAYLQAERTPLSTYELSLIVILGEQTEKGITERVHVTYLDSGFKTLSAAKGYGERFIAALRDLVCQRDIRGQNG